MSVVLRPVQALRLWHDVSLALVLDGEKVGRLTSGGYSVHFGKQIGIMFFCWLGIRLKLAELPADANWKMVYGIATLCGIGFTMSLFIGSLAFEETGVDLLFDERLGIIAGSLASGLLGYLILRNALNEADAKSG